MNTFNKLILAVSVAASFSASATLIPADWVGMENGDSVETAVSNLQSRDDQLAADIHQVHMNTLGKYSESWGLEDRANIAALQESKVDKSLFAADQARQDKALADTVTKQAATDAKQTSDLKSYADKKATSAYQTSVAHTDVKVARADADRKKGDDALQAQIDTNLVTQSARDAGQDEHVNAVQVSAQTANDRASNLEVRADSAEQGIRDVQVSAQTANDRASNLEVRADSAEQGIRDVQVSAQTANDRATGLEGRADATEKVTAQHSSDIQALYGESSYSASRIDAANANIQANRSAITSTNKVVAEHGKTLANHEQRIGALEQNTNRNFADMGKRIDENKRHSDAGIAGVAAMANIPQVTEYQTFAIGAGVGARESESAIAVGFSARASQNTVVKASVAGDSQQSWTVGAGISYGW